MKREDETLGRVLQPGMMDEEPYTCVHEWPEDCRRLQFGTWSVVVGRSDKPAFFEAFLNDPPTFIRGEGEDVSQAEDRAWESYSQIMGCAGHAMVRGGYRNGAGVCAECGMFLARAFDPIELSDDERSRVDALFGGIEGRSATELGEIRSSFSGEQRAQAEELAYAISEMLLEVLDRVVFGVK